MFERTYGLPGSEMNLIACGAIPAGYFTGSKACLLLRLLISAGPTGEELRANFVSRSRAALIGGP